MISMIPMYKNYVSQNFKKKLYADKKFYACCSIFSLRMDEIHNYPYDPVIKFKQTGRSFLYKVIKEGTYPNKSSLVYTLPPNKYRIPDDYVVETTWGRSTNQCTVQCSI